MRSPSVVQIEMCVDQGVAFGDLGGGVLHSVELRVSLWRASYRQPRSFSPLNAEPPSTGMAVMGTGALATRVSDGRWALLVRASRGAKRRVAMDGGAGQRLWDHVLGTDPVGRRKVEVPARGGPHRRKGRTTETDGGSLHWMLLTTEGRADVETARTLLWYELRWRIERFFHALKQGTRIEDRRLDHADDLRTCLAFDAITAFRVWDLTHLARERPDDPATWHVTQEDVTALRALQRFTLV